MMNYKQYKKAVLLLEDGTLFEGKSIGKDGTAYGEICYNTAMTGYQEVFTDPSYFGQLMVTTNAHIGNYGVNNEDLESNSIKISGLICRNFSHYFSRRGSVSSLDSYFEKHNLLAIKDVDTRALVSYVRGKGVMNAVISTELDLNKLKASFSEVPDMDGLELASKVSTKDPYFYGDNNAKFRISVLDLGIKENILRNLAKRGCYMRVFPYDTSFQEMEAFKPDGYFLSNGPGDPKPLLNAKRVAKCIIDRNYPLFGICLGHQIIALANGISTYKMHNGHRGINHPVKNLLTGKGEITSQNHGFVVNKSELESNREFEITHIHLNDNTVAGMQMKNKNCFSVQYHPEASPGTYDSSYIFDQFIENIKSSKK